MRNIVKKLVVAIFLIVAISGIGFGQEYVDNAEMQKLSSSITEGTWFALNETNGNTATVGYSLTSFVYAGTTVSAWNSALLVSSIDGTPLFAQQLVATPTNMLNPTSVGFDDSGAIYLAVEFQDDIIINGITYSPMGNSEMAVIKYSSTGTYQSHVLIQSSDAVIFLDFEVTANGNIHMAGAFEGILYVNGVSTGIVSLGGSTNALVLVVNSAGQFVSGHEIGTSSGSQNWCKAFTIEVDSTGADIVGGEFKGANCSFGGSYTITPAGYDDYFVAKYDGSTCQGVFKIGSGNAEEDAFHIALDGNMVFANCQVPQSAVFQVWNVSGSVGATTSTEGGNQDNAILCWLDFSTGTCASLGVLISSSSDIEVSIVSIMDGEGWCEVQYSDTLFYNDGDMSQFLLNGGNALLSFDSALTPTSVNDYDALGTIGLGVRSIESSEELFVGIQTSGAVDLDFGPGTSMLPANKRGITRYDCSTVVGPTADFSGTPLSIVEGASVAYTDSSIEGTTPIASWTWTFEGGTPPTASGQNPPSVTYNTPGDYDVTLTVSDGSLSDTEIKVDYITVATAVMTFNPTVTSVGSSAGNTSSDLNTNDASASIVISGSGTSISPTTAGTGTTSITASYPENLNVADEIYTITATSAPNGLTATWIITQDGVTPFVLLTPDQANVSYPLGSLTFDIACPADFVWNITGIATWITVSQTSGLGPETITVTYEENPTTVSRSDDFSVSGANAMDVFTLTQAGAPPALSIDPQSVTVSAFAGNTGFDITCNESWTSTTSDSLVIATPNSGTGNESVNVSYPAIYTMTGETYTVTITSNSNLQETFTITQDGVSPFISLSDYEETVGANAGTYLIDIDCPDDLSWTVAVTGENFSSASPNSGTGPMTGVTISYDENVGTDQRVDFLAFSGSGESADFTLTQLGVGAPLEGVIEVNKPSHNPGETVVITCSAAGGTGNYTYNGTISPGGYTFTGTTFSFTATEVGHYTATVIIDDGDNTVTPSVEFDVCFTYFNASADPVAGTVDDEILFNGEAIRDPVDDRTILNHWLHIDGQEILGSGNTVEGTLQLSMGSHDLEQTIKFSDGSFMDTTYLNFVDITVGINESFSGKDINIYPNPTFGQMFISTQGRPEMVSIMNVIGSEVIHRENLEEMTQINLSNLPSGMYFVRVYSSDGMFTTHKVVKK